MDQRIIFLAIFVAMFVVVMWITSKKSQVHYLEFVQNNGVEQIQDIQGPWEKTNRPGSCCSHPHMENMIQFNDNYPKLTGNCRRQAEHSHGNYLQ